MLLVKISMIRTTLTSRSLMLSSYIQYSNIIHFSLLALPFIKCCTQHLITIYVSLVAVLSFSSSYCLFRNLYIPLLALDIT